MSLVDWLKRIGVSPKEATLATLAEEEIDIDAIHALTADELEQLGFKLGARAKIRQAVQPSSGRRNKRQMHAT